MRARGKVCKPIMAPLSAIVTPSWVITGDFPNGCTASSSFGASPWDVLYINELRPRLSVVVLRTVRIVSLHTEDRVPPTMFHRLRVASCAGPITRTHQKPKNTLGARVGKVMYCDHGGGRKEGRSLCRHGSSWKPFMILLPLVLPVKAGVNHPCLTDPVTIIIRLRV